MHIYGILFPQLESCPDQPCWNAITTGFHQVETRRQKDYWTQIVIDMQYCAKVLGHSVFSYLTRNGTNYNEIFTCDRAKRYLQLVT